MKKTIFVLLALALVVASLAGGTAFLLRQKHIVEMTRLAAQAEDKLNSQAFDQAISMLRKVEADGGTDRSAYLLGKAYGEQNKISESHRYYNRLLEQYPKSPFVPEARLAMARQAMDAKDSKEAEDHLVAILASWPQAPAADFALVMLAEISLKSNDEAQARKNLEIVMRKKNSPARSEAEFVIGDLNMKRLKSPDAAPGDEVYTIKRGDTLYVLERQLNVPQDLLIGINDLNPRALSIGQKIRVPRLDISVVINKPDRTLTILNNGDFLKKYRVGLNHDDRKLPAGNYTVGRKYDKGMDYVDPESRETIDAGTVDNPYGKRFIELRRGMGIHGTIDESKVGTLISDGIVMMSNQDIEELYALVRQKTPVTIKGSVNPEANPGR